MLAMYLLEGERELQVPLRWTAKLHAGVQSRGSLKPSTPMGRTARGRAVELQQQ